MADNKNKTYGPYSPVVQAGELYFTAGHIGVDPETKLVDTGIKAQTTKTLDALKNTLAGVGLNLDNVVKTTIFVTDMGEFAEVNEVYMQYFSEPRPARSTVCVKELPRVATNGPVKIEIEAIARKRAT
jgi:2-iminobutanoate/2-iminopropanoate deaminase